MYDANQSYLQNYVNGPNLKFVPNHRFPQIKYTEKPKFNFLGVPLSIPFGVPAGPLLNAKYVSVALNAGFCLPTYKTVRSVARDSHPWPNVLKIRADHQLELGHEHSRSYNKATRDDTPTVVGVPFSENDYKQKNLSISNSFGVPSQMPDVWMEDFSTLKSYTGTKGLHVVLSFQGTNTKKGLFNDIAETCHEAIQTVEKTGFCLLEINLSCPNEVNEPIYKSLGDSVKALKAAHEVTSHHKNIKLIAKIGFMNFEDTYEFVSEVSPFVHALSAINTVSAKIVNNNGHVVLGSASITGGVCGAVILKQGLLMCENLAKAREKCGLKPESFGLIGVGGVSQVIHFNNYRDAGADVVQAATGMMWNLNLAQEIANSLNVSFEKDANVYAV